MKADWIVGIDEAGRGPLAGPVAVGIVVIREDFDWNILAGVTDSKKLSQTKRGTLYASATQLQKDKKLNFTVVQAHAATIDKKGIVIAIRQAIATGLARLLEKNNISHPESVSLRLDGGLVAPDQYPHQTTIIKGDSKEQVIGLASIVAKVTRDAYMIRLANKEAFSVYNFATHKGYGTLEHRRAIAQYGMSSEHRKSYCRNIKTEI